MGCVILLLHPLDLPYVHIIYVLNLLVTRTCIKALMSSYVGQIGPLTSSELAAIECLKMSYLLIMGNVVLMLASSF